MSDAEPVRWGVLGVSNIAVNRVIPAIQRSSNGRLIAIASRTVERARDAAGRLNIPTAYGAYQALLDDANIQAVYIPLPNTLHREWTIRAAQAGKHVLCEKPLGISAAECEEMIAACRQRGVTLMEAFMYRFHPRTLRVAALAREGALGDVRLVRAAFTFRVRDQANNIRLKRELGGGSLYDVGCYCVNASRMILGEPRDAFAFAHVGASGVDEALGGVLRFDGGRLAVIDCGLSTSRREEYEVVGTEGRLTVPTAFLPGTADAEIHLTKGSESSVLTTPGVDQYQSMVEHFAGAVLRGQAVGFPPDDASANLRTIEALLRSARTGRAEPVRA
jgi:predicted dehydrogenase